MAKPASHSAPAWLVGLKRNTGGTGCRICATPKFLEAIEEAVTFRETHPGIPSIPQLFERLVALGYPEDASDSCVQKHLDRHGEHGRRWRALRAREDGKAR